MGIVKQGNISSNGEESSNTGDSMIIEDCLEVSVQDSNQQCSSCTVNSTSSPRRRKHSTPAKKWHQELRKWDNARNMKRGAGARHNRRLENLNYLLNMTEKDEPVDLEFADIVEPQFSAFAGLFMEQEKMRIWNDFINRSEDEQEQWLLTSGHNTCKAVEDSDLEDDVEVIGHDESWEQIDERTIHPGYSADECFKRIDQNLKSLLKKRHFPVGALAWLEKELVSFFTEWPNSVYVSKLPSSFDRMMLHALCQYMDLASHSFDNSDGQRQTEVENHHQDFLAPDVSLSEFIEAKSKKH